MLKSMTIYVGLHIPKCAGTTLLRRVQSSLKPHEVYQNTSMHKNFMIGQPEILQLPRRDQLKFVWGHSLHEEILKYFSNKKVFLFTGFRNPKDRLVSAYLFHNSLSSQLGNELLSWESFSNNNRDGICNFLIQRFPTFAGSEGSLSERAKRVIDVFDHVYFSHNFESSARLIFSLLEIEPEMTNYNVRPQDKNKTLMEVPDNLVVHDEILYEYAINNYADSNNKEEIVNRHMNNDIYRKKYLVGWPDEQKLANFFYSNTYKEYKSWNIFDNVVNTRMNQLKAITLELATYAKMSY